MDNVVKINTVLSNGLSKSIDKLSDSSKPQNTTSFSSDVVNASGSSVEALDMSSFVVENTNLNITQKLIDEVEEVDLNNLSLGSEEYYNSVVTELKRALDSERSFYQSMYDGVKDRYDELRQIAIQYDNMYEIKSSYAAASVGYKSLVNSYAAVSSTILNQVEKALKESGFNSIDELKEELSVLKQDMANCSTSLRTIDQSLNSLSYDCLELLNDYQTFHYDEQVDSSIFHNTDVLSISYSDYCQQNGEVSPLAFVKSYIETDGFKTADDIYNWKELVNLVYASKTNPGLEKRYNYIYANEGIDAANQYLKTIEYQINQTVGMQKAEEFLKSLSKQSDLSSFLLNHLKVIGKGFGDGVGNFFAGFGYLGDSILDMLGCDVSTSYSVDEYETMYILSQLQTDEYSWLSEHSYQISQSLGNMAPSILINALCPPLGLGAMGVSHFGNASHMALVEGANGFDAFTYGFLSSASEVLLGKFLGGIPGLSDVDVKSLKALALNACKEGSEESVQTLIDTGIKAGILDQDVNYNQLFTELYTSFIYGGVSAGVTNSVSLVGSKFLLDTQPVSTLDPKQMSENVSFALDDLLKDRASFVKGLAGVPAGVLNYAGRFKYFSLNNNVDLKNKAVNDGLYHFTTPEAAQKILSSEYVKSGDFFTSYGAKKSFFFAGVPSFEATCVNLPHFEPKRVAVKIKNFNSEDFVYRRFDSAVAHLGDYQFKREDAEIAYLGLVNDNGNLVYKEISADEYENFTPDISDSKLNAARRGAEVVLIGLGCETESIINQLKYMKSLVSKKGLSDIKTKISSTLSDKFNRSNRQPLSDLENTAELPVQNAAVGENDAMKHLNDDSYHQLAASNAVGNKMDNGSLGVVSDPNNISGLKESNVDKNTEMPAVDSTTSTENGFKSLFPPYRYEKINLLDEVQKVIPYSKGNTMYMLSTLYDRYKAMDIDSIDYKEMYQSFLPYINRDFMIKLAPNHDVNTDLDSISDLRNEYDSDKTEEIPIISASNSNSNLNTDSDVETVVSPEVVGNLDNSSDLRNEYDPDKTGDIPIISASTSNSNLNTNSKYEKNGILLKQEILETVDLSLDPVSKVRKLYHELNKRVHYDLTCLEAGEMKRDGMKWNPSLGLKIEEELIASNQNLSFDRLNGDRVVCIGWSSLFAELLIEAGFSVDQVKIMGKVQAHQWVEIDLQDGNIIIADATDKIGREADLINSKIGNPTSGFVMTSKQNSGKRLSRDPGKDQQDAKNNGLIWITEENWLQTDRNLNYVNSNTNNYFDVNVKKAETLFGSANHVTNFLSKFLFDKKIDFDSKTELFLLRNIPDSFDSLERLGYLKQISKSVFTDAELRLIDIKHHFVDVDGVATFEIYINIDGKRVYTYR
ncbi:MAG: hypothetical protein PUB18_01075 [bacterium]|nr:hypothetical protein [bacterium]